MLKSFKINPYSTQTPKSQCYNVLQKNCTSDFHNTFVSKIGLEILCNLAYNPPHSSEIVPYTHCYVEKHKNTVVCKLLSLAKPVLAKLAPNIYFGSKYYTGGPAKVLQ